MDMEFTIIAREPSTKDFGLMINSTGLESNFGRMAQNMKDTLAMAANTVLDATSGTMDPSLQGTGTKIKYMD